MSFLISFVFGFMFGIAGHLIMKATGWDKRLTLLERCMLLGTIGFVLGFLIFA